MHVNISASLPHLVCTLISWEEPENEATLSDFTLSNYRSFYYLGIYTGIGGMQAFLILVSAVALAMGVIFAARTLHDKLLKNILRCPMLFYDTTPLGRVINRFSLDTFTIDETIPIAVQSFLYRLLALFGIIIVITIATPTFLIVIIPLGLFYYFVQVRNYF